MNRRRAFLAALVVAVGLAIAAGAVSTVVSGQSPSYTTVTTFAPVSATPAFGVWYEADVRTGGAAGIVDLAGLGGNLETTQPLPTGAARLTTDLTNAAKAEVALPNNFGVLNEILANLRVSYSWYKVPVEGGNPNAAPSLKLTFYNPVCDESWDQDCYATLVYEPYMNGFGNLPATGVWHRSEIDAYHGTWWTTGGFGYGNDAGGCGPSGCPNLAQYAASAPDLGQAVLVDVRIGVGSYNQGQTGYFDNVTIAGTTADASYDFNPPPQFTSVGECVSSLIAKHCSELTGRNRASCNHAQQMMCFDIFGVK